MTQEAVPYEWNAECQQSFCNLKEALISTPVLAYPVADVGFVLDTDASQVGLGAVLSQVQGDEERVIAYYSKTLGKAEINYCTTRKELLAVVRAVEHFHCYLYGQRFTVRTDHAALTWLLSFKNLEGQLARWLERLQQHNFEIKHRAGRIHNNADALSRRPCAIKDCGHCDRVDTRAGIDVRIVQMTVELDPDLLRIEQEKDDELGHLKGWIKKGERPTWEEISMLPARTKAYWSLWKSLFIEDGLLYRNWESSDGKSIRKQPVIPRVWVPKVLAEFHDSKYGGHFGVNKTLEKVRQRFFWIGCREDVEEWCRKCDTCSAKKGPQTRTGGKLQVYLVGEPFERLAVDILGPLPITDKGNKYVVVVMDYFTKWAEAIALPNQTAEVVAEAMIEQIISRFGVPLELHSDQGRNFESDLFQGVMQQLGIHKTRTTPLHPQSDGLVERMNRTLLDYLSKFINQNQTNWDRLLPFFLLSYRSAMQDSSRQTPAAMLLGRELRLPTDLVFGRPPDKPVVAGTYLNQLRENLQTSHEFARDRLQIAAARMKTRYDRLAKPREFQVGMAVWFHNPKRRKGRCPKLQSDWEGPYRIETVLTDVTLRIRKSVRAKPRIVHVDRLAPYHGEKGLNQSLGVDRAGQS